MTEKRIMLLAAPDTTAMVSLSKVEKYQITPQIRAVMPPR